VSIEILRSDFWKSQVDSDTVNEILPNARSASRIFAVVAEPQPKHISHLLHSVRSCPVQCLASCDTERKNRRLGAPLWDYGMADDCLDCRQVSTLRLGLRHWLETDSDDPRHQTPLPFARNRYGRPRAFRSSATSWS
jgi:hypothetical protein